MKRRLTVLIVEDSDAAAIVLLRELCKKFDIVAERIDSSAAEVLAGQRWDVIIADFGPKGVKRKEILDMVSGRSPVIPLVVIADAGGEDVTAAVRQAGACTYVERCDLGGLSMIVEWATRRDRASNHYPCLPPTVTSFDEWVSLKRGHAPIPVDVRLGGAKP